MSTDKRISFRITDNELIQKLEEKLSRTKISASTYLRELVERDLDSEHGTDINPRHPIGDLIQRYVPIITRRYQAAIERTGSDIDPREDELLINLLDQSLKILHDPDRSDMALMTQGELEKALRDVYLHDPDKEGPLTLHRLSTIAHRNIHEAKRRDYVGSTEHVTGHNHHEAIAAEDPSHYHRDVRKKPNGDLPKSG